MPPSLPARPREPSANRTDRTKAVLGPTNTGKTHLAIERLCAHSSGAIGFPLRLLAREVYDRVCAIKGANRVALITGEERIEPRDARWHLCTMEAMPVRDGSGSKGLGDLAFIGLDEAQLSADRERGHVFTDRLLHLRGREETMILGAATLAPMVRKLVPEAEIVSRPRFSTLSHAGSCKLSRLAPRSVIVAFSAAQVYAVAEMLRRFRGGAAVVMGALSPQTRNAQVALYQSGEVDYLVATDAIGMGLNLDVNHVAFAGLSKFDGQRQRRLTTAEMAQIAGRAGRHQRDGTFGTLSGSGGHDAEFTEQEIYAIEENRFAPLTALYWRNAEPGFADLDTLIGDLEMPPDEPGLVSAPEAIDLAVLKRLSDDPDISASLRSPAQLRRFWQACSLPDFRQHGAETHARFVARLWQELRHGPLASDHAPRAIAQLDTVTGDIDTLQGRIAAIRSWSYISQRPDWVLAQAEMAARAQAVEARLSDALHARLTERFVNRRTAVLMRKLGPDAALLPVKLAGDTVLVDGEAIGQLAGFRFIVDATANHADRKLLLAAAERHLPALLAERARKVIALCAARDATELQLREGAIAWHGDALARLTRGRAVTTPQLTATPALGLLPAALRSELLAALADWLQHQLRVLAPLQRIAAAATDPAAGPALRALLIRLAESGGMLPRVDSGLDQLDSRQRDSLRRLGLRIGALDLYQPAVLRAGPLRLWQQLALVAGQTPPPVAATMALVLTRDGRTSLKQPALLLSGIPFGYRVCGSQLLRIDRADALLREAHARRVAAGRQPFMLDPQPALAIGLTTASYAQLLRLGGFRAIMPRPLAQDAFGPPRPLVWRWQPVRPDAVSPPPPPDGAFAALARLVA